MDGGNRSNEITFQQAIAGLNQLNQRLDFIRLPVTGNSMTPMLKDRDILEVGIDHLSKLVPGDIVVRGKHELITHRVIATKHQRVYTKGDARYWIDLMQGRDDILGKVIRIERNGLIADMESTRWRVANRLVGLIGWMQVYLVWSEQLDGRSKNGRRGWLHRLSFWISKRLNWVILFVLTGKWLRQKSLRMDEKC